MEDQKMPASSAPVDSSTIHDKMTNFYFSKYMKIFYLLLFILCLFSLIWACMNFGEFPSQLWFLGLELLLFLALGLELVIRIYVTTWKLYIRKFYNKFDFPVTIICMAVLLGALILSGAVEFEMEDLLVSLALVIRNIILLIRILLVYKEHDRSLPDSLVLQSSDNPTEDMQERLVVNKEIIKYVYKARLDPLIEEDEKYESTFSVASPTWKEKYAQENRDSPEKRFSPEMHIESLNDSDEDLED